MEIDLVHQMQSDLTGMTKERNEPDHHQAKDLSKKRDEAALNSQGVRCEEAEHYCHGRAS